MWARVYITGGVQSHVIHVRSLIKKYGPSRGLVTRPGELFPTQNVTFIKLLIAVMTRRCHVKEKLMQPK